MLRLCSFPSPVFDAGKHAGFAWSGWCFSGLKLKTPLNFGVKEDTGLFLISFSSWRPVYYTSYKLHGQRLVGDGTVTRTK